MALNRDATDFTGIADGYAEAQDYTSSEADEELASRIQELFRRAYEHRLPFERRWEFHRLYLKGEVIPMRDRYTGEVTAISTSDAKRLYSINNQLSPAARSLVAKLARMIPAYVVTPPTNDIMEVYGARVADQFLSYANYKERFNVKYVEAQENLTWCGTSIYQLNWNSEAGREITVCDECNYKGPPDMEGEFCPRCSIDLQEAQESATASDTINNFVASQVGHPPLEPTVIEKVPPQLGLITEGDFEIEVFDPRDFFPEPGCNDHTKLRYAIRRHRLPVTEVRRRFPHMAAFIAPDADAYADRQAFSLFDESSARTFLEDYCIVYEYHEAPSFEYPKGRIVHSTATLILSEIEGLSGELKRLPFFFNWWLRRPAEFWGEPFITQAWHRQKELNHVETMLREHLELNVFPRLLDPIGSRIAVDEIKASSAQRIKYNAAAGRPEFLQPPALPPDVYQRRNILIDDIRLQAAITQNEAGLMGSDPNGRAMAIIQAEADQQIGPIITRNFNELGELFRGVLVLVQHRYDKDKKFSIPGDESTEVYAFDEMKMSPGWDIRLEVQDGLAQNQAIRIQQAMELLNAGVLGNPQVDPNVPKRFARIAKLKLPGMGQDPAATDFAAALEIPVKIEKGEPVAPSPWDDPAVFADALVGWLKTVGRRRGMEDSVVQGVSEITQYYVEWAQFRVMPMAPQGGFGGAGGPGAGGTDTTAPGGTPNSPGKLPGGDTPIANESQRTIGQADQSAEDTAHPGPHES